MTREDAPGIAEKVAYLRALPEVEEVIETHMAFVFLTGTEAFKMKKPVRFGHFDHRTLDAREAACSAEVRVNALLAPGVYRGLVPLTLSAGRFALGGTDRPVDWLVHMRRLPARLMLDEMIGRGAGPSPADLAALADLLAGFYRGQGRHPPRKGLWLSHSAGDVALCTERLHAYPEHVAAERVDGLARAWTCLTESAATEIAYREANRFVVDGHGDLRPEHVCLERPPVIFDRVEFSEDMRVADVFEEIGFLGLECARLGRPELGTALAVMLAERGFEPPSPGLRAAFTVRHCLARARISLDHLLDPEPRTPEVWPVRARDYLARAEAALGKAGLADACLDA